MLTAFGGGSALDAGPKSTRACQYSRLSYADSGLGGTSEGTVSPLQIGVQCVPGHLLTQGHTWGPVLCVGELL